MEKNLRNFNIILGILFIVLLFIVSWLLDLIIISIIYFAFRKKFGYIPKKLNEE